MTNALVNNENDDGLPPSVARIRLDTPSTVRAEMAKLYRLARGGKLELEKLGKLIYALKEIRCCLEGESLERLEAQMADLSQRTTKQAASWSPDPPSIDYSGAFPSSRM